MLHQAHSRKNIATIMEEQAQRLELAALSKKNALSLLLEQRRSQHSRTRAYLELGMPIFTTPV
jgi:hypothetical protein